MGLPTASAQGDSFIAISTGYKHSLAIKADGTLWSWGGNEYGTLCNGTSVKKQTTPAKIMSDVKAVSAGTYHSVAIKNDKTLWLWGRPSKF